MNIHEYIPPLLSAWFGNLHHSVRSKKYDSFEEAFNDSGQNAYENEELCNVIADKTVVLSLRLLEKPFIMKPLPSYLLNAVYSHLAEHSISVTVADYGGACGAHYFEVRRFIPPAFRINWFVIETPQMVKSAKSRNLENEELKFVVHVSDIEKKIDIVHTSCALHYVRNPYQVIDDLARLKAKSFVVNRMMLNTTDSDFITVQQSRLSSNGEGPLPAGYNDRKVSYPYTTLSRSKFINAMKKNNYETKWVFEEMHEMHQTFGMKIYAQGLLFSLIN